MFRKDGYGMGTGKWKKRRSTWDPLQHKGRLCRYGIYKIKIVFIMMTSSNGNIFRVTGPLCGEFTGPGEFPTQRPVTRSFDVFFDLRLTKRLNKQPWDWWFETPSLSLWRHCYDNENSHTAKTASLYWNGSQVRSVLSFGYPARGK